MTRKGARAVGIAAVLALSLLAVVPAAQAAELGRCVKCPTANTPTKAAPTRPRSPLRRLRMGSSSEQFYGHVRDDRRRNPVDPRHHDMQSWHRSGTITGPKTSTAVDTFTGCEGAGEQCHTLNTATPGEIRTFTLEGTLIEHGEKGLERQRTRTG